MTNPTPLTKEQEEIVVAFMTDLQEKLSDILQPMLEIAEGKRSIDEWNDYAEKLLIVAENHEAKAIKQERNRIVEIVKKQKLKHEAPGFTNTLEIGYKDACDDLLKALENNER